MDHDQRFKKLIRDFFAEFFALFFADWLDLFDLSAVTWLEQEISPEPAGTRNILDLVARVRCRRPLPGWHDDAATECLLVVLIEIESADNTTSIRARLPRYAWTLRSKLDLPVLPVVLFLKVGLDGIGVETHERRIGALVAERMDFLYVGLPALDAVQYVEGDNWLGVALSALMRIPRDRVAWLGAEAMRRLQLAPLTGQQKHALWECVEAYLPLNDEQWRELEGLLETETFSEVKAVNLTTFEKGLMKGEALGIQKGREEGKMEGRIENLLGLIELKFGPLDPAATEKITSSLASRAQLQAVQKKFLDASSLGDFLRSLDQD